MGNAKNSLSQPIAQGEGRREGKSKKAKCRSMSVYTVEAAAKMSLSAKTSAFCLFTFAFSSAFPLTRCQRKF